MITNNLLDYCYNCIIKGKGKGLYSSRYLAVPGDTVANTFSRSFFNLPVPGANENRTTKN